MKKYFIYLVVLLFGIITITVWWFLSDNSSRPGFDAINSIKERSGPVFQEEGILYFIHPDLSDTIKSIKIEVADNPEKISRGLMYRNSLDDNQGMLFIFDAEQEKTFWMKNTRFSLDIIFINSDILHNIASRCTPCTGTCSEGPHIFEQINDTKH